MGERCKNFQWTITPRRPQDTNEAALCVLMDIRDELQALNRVMQCSNVARGFGALAEIAARDERLFKKRVADAAAKLIKRSA